jgi:pimeloyl-ACP methyl ester carboxylesterase
VLQPARLDPQLSPRLAGLPRANALGLDVPIADGPLSRLLVIAEFFPGFGTFDKADALDALADVPTTVIGGTLDQITPISHTQRIAELLPTATLVEVTGAGHMVLLEFHDEVNDAIAALIERATDR